MNKWRDIRLELARTAQFPSGSVSRGYLLKLPLNEHDRIDRAAFDRNPRQATVRRYWSSEPDEAGLLHRADRGWSMRCDGNAERMLLLDDCPLRLGSQISVVEQDGQVIPFNVASIR